MVALMGHRLACRDQRTEEQGQFQLGKAYLVARLEALLQETAFTCRTPRRPRSWQRILTSTKSTLSQTPTSTAAPSPSADMTIS